MKIFISEKALKKVLADARTFSVLERSGRDSNPRPPA